MALPPVWILGAGSRGASHGCAPRRTWIRVRLPHRPGCWFARRGPPTSVVGQRPAANGIAGPSATNSARTLYAGSRRFPGENRVLHRAGDPTSDEYEQQQDEQCSTCFSRGSVLPKGVRGGGSVSQARPSGRGGATRRPSPALTAPSIGGRLPPDTRAASVGAFDVELGVAAGRLAPAAALTGDSSTIQHADQEAASDEPSAGGIGEPACRRGRSRRARCPARPARRRPRPEQLLRGRTVRLPPGTTTAQASSNRTPPWARRDAVVAGLLFHGGDAQKLGPTSTTRGRRPAAAARRTRARDPRTLRGAANPGPRSLAWSSRCGSRWSPCSSDVLRFPTMTFSRGRPRDGAGRGFGGYGVRPGFFFAAFIASWRFR